MSLSNCAAATVQSCHVFLLRNHCRVQTSTMFVLHGMTEDLLLSLFFCVSAFVLSQCRSIGASTVRRVTVLVGSRNRAPSVIHAIARSIATSVLWFCVFLPIPLSNMNNEGWYAFVCQLIHCCANLWLFLWTQISRVHSSVVRAADCRSAGPWFKSGRRSWFTFVTGSGILTNLNVKRSDSMSPIARKSVKISNPFEKSLSKKTFQNIASFSKTL